MSGHGSASASLLLRHPLLILSRLIDSFLTAAAAFGDPHTDEKITPAESRALVNSRLVSRISRAVSRQNQSSTQEVPLCC